MKPEHITMADVTRQMLLKPMAISVDGDEREVEKRSTSQLNVMALVLFLLVVGVGGYFYSLKRSLFFLGVPVEALCFLGVIFLNNRKQFFNANLLMLITNVIFIGYWSTILGEGISIEMLLVFMTVITFHLTSSFVLYKKTKILLYGIIGCGLMVIYIILNSYLRFITPLELSKSVTAVMRWATSIALLVFILGVLTSYATQINGLLIESRRLQMASERKTAYLSEVFHEVRTPLNVVYSIAQVFLLKKDKLSTMEDDSCEEYQLPNGAEMADQLYTSTALTRNIINHVLEIAKIESGKFIEINKEDFSLFGLVNSTIAAHSYLASPKGIKIELSIEDSLKQAIYSDRMILTKIFNNLLSNSIKYSTNNTVVRVTLKKTGEWWTLEITNTGKIDPKIARAVFERFVGKSEGDSSSGLGLAITKHLVEVLGGEISIVPTPDPELTTLFVKLPYEAGVKPVIQLNKVADGKNIFWKSKVLLFEDDQMGAGWVMRFLKKWGIDAKLFRDENEDSAITSIEAESPNLVIADLNMPGLSGEMLLKRMKQHPTLKSIPVLIVSASESFTESHAIALGAAGFLKKPIDFGELCLALAKHLPYRAIM
ncbi:hybrid sensor histidine kinase/response regulator [Chitinophaga qingshengii]|uniref:histidine kinase n=1 Tax=Chitinophaga qingshengii TaxID=1569794 RepID=A0ABR7TFS2_9BACT|nr:hybrid sensor histidine kinase/response regulator [Chitinophaga qingshengii]MBC9929212.1 hybrid sensor histidine kinase/response regulator [Chitinophaga qingshengii]